MLTYVYDDEIHNYMACDITIIELSLSIDLDDFAETINEKMNDYWRHAARNVPLQNICRLLNFVEFR